MKKNLFKVLLGIFVLLIGFPVSAEVVTNKENIENGASSDTQTVIVGEVEKPVYNVNFFWSDLSFDWGYDAQKQEYGWFAGISCSPIQSLSQEEYYARVSAGEKVYTDDSCLLEASDYNEELSEQYYEEYIVPTSLIEIEDFSEKGQIVPSLLWSSTEEYSYVDANLRYYNERCAPVDSSEVYELIASNGEFALFDDNTCSNKVSKTGYEAGKYYALVVEQVELTTPELPDSARITAYEIYEIMEGLESISLSYYSGERRFYSIEMGLINKVVPTKSPSAGDAIGNITISIRAK